MIISRITQDEAEVEIVNCKSAIKELESTNESYLRTLFSDFEYVVHDVEENALRKLT
jgi:hypothetical protein